ncbi:MAG: hypothetical protein QOI98_1367, partial [Solirubrobacteraceae bacterium]|nr:hypothetical protein [Solirubrobacteraceae bacterium]
MAVSRVTRRRLIRDAGVAGAGLAASTSLGRTASAIAASTRRQTVAVFGGGIAGLTAAHELAERGFDVTIYERRAWGGKARSTEVPGTGTGGRKNLPGEHGWRVFFGFYQNLPDTFRRIPYGSHPQGVFDNLVGAPQLGVSRDGGRRDLTIPLGAADPRVYTPAEVLDLVIGAALQLHLPPQAVAQFADRMLVYFSSCDARRIGQWENVNWIDFSGGDRYGDDYRRILVNSVSEVVQASKAERTSAQFPSHVWELVIYNLLRRNSNGAVFRFMNRPTNEALIDPWLRVLDGLGVQRRMAHELVGWNM